MLLLEKKITFSSRVKRFFTLCLYFFFIFSDAFQTQVTAPRRDYQFDVLFLPFPHRLSSILSIDRIRKFDVS